MATVLVDYNGLLIPDPDPTGAAGLALKENFVVIADELSALYDALTTKSGVNHDHNADYATIDHSHTPSEIGAYTTSQVDGLLADKADASELSAHLAAANPHGITAAMIDAFTTSQTATAITNSIAGHVIAVDPHGDRAYADGLVSALESDVNTALAGKASTNQFLTVNSTLNTHLSAVDPHGDREYTDLSIAALGSPGAENFLINGGFDFFQRVNPDSYTAVSGGAYYADRWVCLHQGTSNVKRTDTDYGYAIERRMSGASTGILGNQQVLEASITKHLRGQTVRFQASFQNVTPGKNVYMAILSWSGTANSSDKHVVFNWNSMDFEVPGAFFKSTNQEIVGFNSYVADGNWQEGHVVGEVPANCNNLICFIWTGDNLNKVANADIFYVTRCGLYLGSAARAWAPRPVAQELALCQRYYEKSFAVDTRPANQVSIGSIACRVPLTHTHNFLSDVRYKVTKRSTPTVTIHNPDFNLTGTANNFTRGWNQPVATGFPSPAGFSPYINNETSDEGNEFRFHWIAESEI